LFKERYEKWRDGKENHEKGQIPDFLIEYPDKILGIEHTEPYKTKVQSQAVSPQKREGSLRKIVNNAKRFYEERNNPPLKVDVWFSSAFEKTRITHKKTKEVSQKLAKFVEKELPRANSLDSHIVKPKENLPEIDKILITTRVPKHCGQWTKQGAAWAKRNFIDDLQECIDRKNKEYETYITNCDECWLLIVADLSNPAQCFTTDYPSEVFDHTYQSKFSRTFYLEVTARPVRLKTTWQ